MTEEVKKEELVEEGEIVEIESEETEKNEVDSEPVEEVQAEESKEKEEDPELEDYSDRVKKRISNLTRRLREAERASESAYTYANPVPNDVSMVWCLPTENTIINVDGTPWTGIQRRSAWVLSPA